MRNLVEAVVLLASLPALATATGAAANSTATIKGAAVNNTAAGFAQDRPAAADPPASAAAAPLLRGARIVAAPAPAAAAGKQWETAAIRTGDFALLGIHPNIEGAVNVTANPKDGTESLVEMAAAADRCDSPEQPMNGKCTGCPPKYNGKLCATTTWYEDRTKGSCGCGMSEMVGIDTWPMTSFTAALNTVSMDPSNPALTYCLKGCGCCFELCTTGGQVNSELTKPDAQKCQVFKVTNRCADGWKEGRPDWCSNHMPWADCQADPSKCRERGNTNKYGYAAHFDLQDANRQVQHKLGWINPEVTFEPVSCDRWTGPPDADCPGCSGL